MASVTMSFSYMKLRKTYPLIWRELRTAMGMPETDDEEEAEDEDEGQDKKRIRHDE